MKHLYLGQEYIWFGFWELQKSCNAYIIGKFKTTLINADTIFQLVSTTIDLKSTRRGDIT